MCGFEGLAEWLSAELMGPGQRLDFSFIDSRLNGNKEKGEKLIRKLL